MTRFQRVACSAAWLMLFTSPPAWAQGSAELNGRVTDESGAVLPGVTVTATQTDTGFSRADVTDAAGSYLMPNWGTPVTNLAQATFGRIQTQATDPRILQFGLKYAF